MLTYKGEREDHSSKTIVRQLLEPLLDPAVRQYVCQEGQEEIHNVHPQQMDGRKGERRVGGGE